jgi:hypothetical protein
MRKLVLALAFLALPTLAVAQQAEVTPEFGAPKVEMQQSTPTSPAAVDAVSTDRADDAAATTEAPAPADNAAVMQDPTQPRWWWLVGAIVVAGIILAVIL